MTHTPLPWKKPIDDRVVLILAQDGGVIAHFLLMDRDRNQQREDRDFVLRAVNAHDAMVTALEALLRCPEIADCDPRDKDQETHAAERAARNALALAKEPI